MVGGEEHFTMLEALKRLFRHLWQHSLHFAKQECFHSGDREK